MKRLILPLLANLFCLPLISLPASSTEILNFGNSIDAKMVEYKFCEKAIKNGTLIYENYKADEYDQKYGSRYFYFENKVYRSSMQYTRDKNRYNLQLRCFEYPFKYKGFFRN